MDEDTVTWSKVVMVQNTVHFIFSICGEHQ